MQTNTQKDTNTEHTVLAWLVINIGHERITQYTRSNTQTHKHRKTQTHTTQSTQLVINIGHERITQYTRSNTQTHKHTNTEHTVGYQYRTRARRTPQIVACSAMITLINAIIAWISDQILKQFRFIGAMMITTVISWNCHLGPALLWYGDGSEEDSVTLLTVDERRARMHLGSDIHHCHLHHQQTGAWVHLCHLCRHCRHRYKHGTIMDQRYYIGQFKIGRPYLHIVYVQILA